MLLLGALVFATVRFVQWMRGSGPFDRRRRTIGDVSEEREALREQIRERQGRDDPHEEGTDLNDEWMASGGFGSRSTDADDAR